MSAVGDDSRLLRLEDGDSVAMARELIAAGQSLLVEGVPTTVTVDVPLGFKVAIRDLPAGTTIIRAGVPIGRLTADVRRGELVHLHNLESLYLRTHDRGES